MSLLKRAVAIPTTGSESPAESAGMMHSLRVYPAYRMLIIGTLGTNTAFWMYQVAVGWLALELTDSPFFVGLAGFAGGIPMLVLSLPAGVVIDRYDRRRVLLLSQSGVLVIAGLFATLVGADLIARWSILVLVFAYGCVMTFIFPTRTTMVASLIKREDMANAIALNAAAQNATRVIGPSVAGVLIATIGVAGTFAAAALLQIFALWTTLHVPSNPPDPSSRGAKGLSSLTVGLKIVAKSPFLTALIMLALAPTVLVMPYINLMPVFAKNEMGLGAKGLGLMLAGIGIGTVFGSLWVARSPSLRTKPGAQLITAAAFAVLVMIFAVTPNIWAATALLFAAGCMSAAYLAMNQTALQLHVADEVRGRVLSIYLLTWGMLPLGQLAIGALANRIGTPHAVVVGCLCALIAIAFMARKYPSLRS